MTDDPQEKPPGEDPSPAEGAENPAPVKQGMWKSFRTRLKSRHSPARNTLDNLGTSIVTIPLIMASNILVARTLGADLRGVFQFLLLFRAFFVPFTLFGFNAALTYFISNRKYEVKDVAFTGVVAGLFQGLIATLLILLLWKLNWLGDIAHEAPVYALWLMASLMPLHVSFLFITRILQGDSRFALQNRLNVVREVLAGISALVLVVALKREVMGATVAVALTSVTTFALGMASLWWIYRPRFRIDFHFLREGYSYGWRAFIGNMAAQANFRLDQVVLAYFCRPETLAWYAIGAKLTERLWMIPNAISFVIFNKITKHKGVAKSAELIDQVHRPLFWMMASISFVLGVVSLWLIPLVYGQDFAPAAYALVLLLPGSLAVPISRILSKYFAGKGKPGVSSAAALVGFVASAILYPTFILIFRRFEWFSLGSDGASVGSAGFLGAAIACTLVYCIVAYANIWFYRRDIAPRKPALFGLKRGDIGWAVAQIRRGMGREKATQTVVAGKDSQQDE